MGDWIKENKFEAGLLGVVLLAVIAAFLLGGKQGGEYQLQKERFGDAARKKATLEGKKPYPNPENVEAYTEKVADYAKVIEGLQDKLLAFRPAEFDKITPSEFTEALTAARTELAERYTDAGIEFPENWHLGFAKYTDSPPPDDATAYLKFQLDAMGWLFSALADARPSVLMNVHRKELPVELGKSMDGGDEAAEESGSSRSRSRSRSRTRKPAVESKPYYSLPVELTFKGPEPALRKFLAAVTSNDEHFFVVRTLRIQNEKRDKAPKKDDVEFDAGPIGGAGDAFKNDFDDELIPDDPAPEGDPLDAPLEDPPVEDPPADAPPADEGGGERILGQVLGSEEVFVFVELDLLLFKPKDEVKMPEL